MAQFIATVTSRSGQRRQVSVRASDVASARRLLRQRGITASQLEPAPAKPTRVALDLNRLLEARPGVREKALFANKLAALVDAGVPIVRSLDLMARQQRQPLFKRALEQVSADVNQGGSLGEALRRWPQVFDPLTVAMVEAGEAGGVLDESLRRLARVLEGNAKLQNQIRGAMGYPVAVLAIAVLVFLGMTIFLIPTFAGIFADLGAELPPFTQLMVDLSALLRSSFSLLLVAGLAIGVWLFQRHRATAEGRRQVDGLLLRLPLFGDLIQKTATAQFCRTFSSLTRAGVPILLSLEIVQDTAGNAVIADAIVVARQEVLEGVPLSVAQQEQRRARREVEQWLRQHRGRLEERAAALLQEAR